MPLELILRRGAAVRCLQLLGKFLRRKNAVVERRGNVAELLGDGDFIGLRRIAADEQRDRLAPVLAWLCRGRPRHWRAARCLQTHRHDLILGAEWLANIQCVTTAAQRQVAPREFLDRPDAGVLLLPVRVGLRLALAETTFAIGSLSSTGANLLTALPQAQWKLQLLTVVDCSALQR